jgi:NADPH2:quinone reductase
MLKGCTAEMLIERCARVEAGETVLVHAAAGGVGSILVPWLKSIGATVIAHAGNSKKVEIAKELGADHALCCLIDDLQVRSGAHRRKGVQVVLDGVGAASWPASIASSQAGLLVTYGNASGPVPAFTALDLLKAGPCSSLGRLCSTMFRHPMKCVLRRARLFEMVASGSIQVQIGPAARS